MKGTKNEDYLMNFDLMSTVEYGGCSVKLPPEALDKLLKGLHFQIDEDLLVGTDTHDDAAVYKLNEEQAIIFTTDFFPPLCSDAFTFGQIAASNALSDVYAMGGKVLMALNLIMFPSSQLPIEVLRDILEGGADKVHEAGGLIVGGHTIDDFPPKYGLAVVGLVHPDKIITNAKAKAGDALILTKAIGTGTILAGKRMGLVDDHTYLKAIESMKQLNKSASDIMSKHGIVCATDITGFGLFGHLLKMAKGSNVCLQIDVDKVPFISGALDLVETGCIPGASFRNQRFVEAENVDTSHCTYEQKMLLCDAQTSGGMVMCVPNDKADELVKELKIYYEDTAIIGSVRETPLMPSVQIIVVNKP
jgi:selenide,water dikinase